MLRKLAHTTSSPAISPEYLQLLGKQAAAAYLEQGGDLGSAVKEAVLGQPITPAQVSRVTEHANRETWLALQGPEGAPFTPADANQVLQSLSVSPTVVEGTDLDYEMEVSYQTPPDNLDLFATFGVQRPQEEEENPDEGVFGKVASRYTEVLSASEEAERLLANAGEVFYARVREAVIDQEQGLLAVAHAVSSSVEDSEFAKDIMQKCASRLQAEGYVFQERVEHRKLASCSRMEVDLNHPLCASAQALEDAAYKASAVFAREEQISRIYADTEKLKLAHLRKRLLGEGK